MKTVKVRELIPKAVPLLGYPQELVEDVVNHQFEQIFSFLKEPHLPALKLENLGTFRVHNMNILEHQIKDIIKLIRKLENPQYAEYYKERLRVLWKLRRATQLDRVFRKYSLRIKDE